jgi:hypothetical protein
MHMLYNSDSFVVVQFEVPVEAALPATPDALTRGGYEIVDKFARKEIFIDGAMAQSFKDGVAALIEARPAGPTQEEMDDYLERFASLMHQPVVMH